MSDPATKAELMRSLGRLVRGLSALFWGLPIGLVIFGLLWIQTITLTIRPNLLTQWLQSLSIFPPLAATGFLLYGLIQLHHFQPKERIWQSALERAQILAFINFGLSPFLHWWNRIPYQPIYALSVSVLMLTAVLFLASLNQVLCRLAAMLPDETLRAETRFFGTLNIYLLMAILLLLITYFFLLQFASLPHNVAAFLQALEMVRQWLLLFLVLLPVAMTMTLLWKIKEAILEGVFRETLQPDVSHSC